MTLKATAVTTVVPTRLGLIRSVQSLRSLGQKRRLTAPNIVGTILHEWSSGVCPGLARSTLPTSRKLKDISSIAIFVEQLKRLPILDAAYWLSTAYTTLSPPEYRKRMAMYFTPPSIAARMIDDVEKEGARFDRDTFMDPACGGAAFLAVVGERMRLGLKKSGKSPQAILKHAEAHLVGADLDSTLCAMARHFLAMVFHEEIAIARRQPRFQVVCIDSLRTYTKAGRRYDVILCNPPFRKLTQREVEPHWSQFNGVLQGQPNLYSLFVNLTIRLAKPDGIVGLVTPTSFLSGQHFCSLRTFLLLHTRIKRIGLIQHRAHVYFNVEQETALTVLRSTKHTGRKQPTPIVSLVERNGTYREFGTCPLPNSGSSWPLARDAPDVELLNGVRRSPYRLSDYGYTAGIGGFVWNRDTRPAYLTKHNVPKTRADAAVPLIWASDVLSDGTLDFDHREANEEQHRYVDLGDAAHPMIKRRPAVVLQRVTTNDQANRLAGAVVSEKFIKDHGGFVGENHTVILEQTADDPKLTPSELLALLKTRVVDRYFRCISGSANVSLFELAQLPLPDPAKLRRKLASGVPVEKAAEILLLGDHRKKR